MTDRLELTENAIIELAREGGFASIPKLALPRRFVLASVAPSLRVQLCAILRNALAHAREPGQPDSPGRGDQYYYRIHISDNAPNNQADADIVLLIPEFKASEELEALWRNGLSE